VIVQDLTYPLIENAESFVVQGYSYADYLEELPDPMSTIYSKSSIDMAMTVACEWLAGGLLPGANGAAMRGFKSTQCPATPQPAALPTLTSRPPPHCTAADNNTRDWMMRTLNMTEDQVITAITVAVDFGITQVGT
jgi:hypothetical protein